MAPLGAVCGDVARVTRRARTWVTHLSEQGMTPAAVWPLHCHDCGVGPHTPGAHSLPSGWGEKSSLVKSLEVNINPFPSGIRFLEEWWVLFKHCKRIPFSLLSPYFFFFTNCCRVALEKQISIQNNQSFPYSECNSPKCPPRHRETSSFPWEKEGIFHQLKIKPD